MMINFKAAALLLALTILPRASAADGKRMTGVYGARFVYDINTPACPSGAVCLFRGSDGLLKLRKADNTTVDVGGAGGGSLAGNVDAPLTGEGTSASHLRCPTCMTTAGGTFTGALSLPAGTAADPSLLWTEIGLYRSAVDKLSIASSGNQKAFEFTARADIAETALNFFNAASGAGVGSIVPDADWFTINHSSLIAIRAGMEVNTAFGAGTVPNNVVIYGVTGAGARAITGPSNGVAGGKVIIVKDEGGNASTGTITFTPASGLIDGAANKTITANYGVIRAYFRGGNWFTF